MRPFSTVALLTYLVARVLGTWELYLIALTFAAMTVVAWVARASRGRGCCRSSDEVTPDSSR